jgi:hypothetical protein
MKSVSSLILVFLTAFSQPAQAEADPCAARFGVAWESANDPILEGYAYEFLTMGNVTLKVKICKADGVNIGGIIAQAGLEDINGENHLIIGIDSRFQRLAGSRVRPIIAHEVAHVARPEHSTCPLLLAGRLVDLFINCEHRVDVLTSEWTSSEATIEALAFAADYADALDGSSGSSGTLRIRIKMLKERKK